jgi:hypothetical protein
MIKKIAFKPTIITIVITIIVITSLSSKTSSSKDKLSISSDTLIVEIPRLLDQTDDYLFALGALESNNDYTARRFMKKEVNGESNIIGSQYLGRHQLGNAVRVEIGASKLNSVDGYNLILTDSLIQDIMIFRLLQYQIGQMEDHIIKYDKTRVGKWWVTKSGIIAMSHLLGVSNAKKFLDSNGKYIPHDGNNRPITDYLQLNNFNIEINSINGDEYFRNFALFALGSK